jgi:hypothetical protein
MMKKTSKQPEIAPQKSPNSKLRNQFREIPFTRVAEPVLQTNISAAC